MRIRNPTLWVPGSRPSRSPSAGRSTWDSRYAVFLVPNLEPKVLPDKGQFSLRFGVQIQILTCRSRLRCRARIASR